MRWLSKNTGNPGFERLHELFAATDLKLRCVTRRDGPDGDHVTYTASLVRTTVENDRPMRSTLWSSVGNTAENAEDARRKTLDAVIEYLGRRYDEAGALYEALRSARLSLGSETTPSDVALDNMPTFGRVLDLCGVDVNDTIRVHHGHLDVIPKVMTRLDAQARYDVAHLPVTAVRPAFVDGDYEGWDFTVDARKAVRT